MYNKTQIVTDLCGSKPQKDSICHICDTLKCCTAH